VGGDVFALIWKASEKDVVALNGSGRAPMGASIDDLRAKGHRQMPGFGPLSVSVPGTVHGWEVLLETEGTISLADALQPAIDYAEQGFPVSDIIGFQWQQQQEKLAALSSGQELLTNGRAPREGEMMRLPTLAKTLRTVACLTALSNSNIRLVVTCRVRGVHWPRSYGTRLSSAS